MSKISLMAGASRFAHFAGLTRGGARASDDDDQDEGKSGKRGSRASDDDDDHQDEGKSGKRGSRASDDDDDQDEGKSGKRGSRASDDDDDQDEGKSGKRGSRASDDDDEDDDDREEMTGNSRAAAARRRERARCAAIFAHPVAAANPQLACSLAFNTTQTRAEAIAVMKGQSGRAPDREQGNRHARRDRADRNVDLGSDHDKPSGRKAVQGSWSASLKRLGIKQREG